ncbi:Twinfilin-2 [Wickerhamomyces ciferrii]|uniref:Twinfilin-2 n=1 Tax=Wickerhamomyces ciferrii (strain ATCC 14091 / BCRC 22168 / CBS 111 / JCM 3599 / NBRC 0793 / NRRL Y-1031 F-60-10) TaxID=1206466 RepID=K0KY35_WICCF|nr:Twinfilin-2 [Wickerhamomyces ciferrii]CCH46013.1 Twinfilin-2 [Wickerhamomyces ciferrii]
MSAQSGISASAELSESFKTFIDKKQSILLAYIYDEEVKLSNIIEGSSSLKNDFNELKDLVDDSKPQYIIIKHDYNDKLYSFVSFVPDYAAVKDKMLYASSKNTLIRALGSEFFTHILFWNSVDEVSYENWKQSASGDAASNSLSTSEKELQDVKDLEFETVVNTSTKRQLVNHKNELSFKFNPNAKINPEANTLYSFNIDIPKEEIFLSNTSSVSTPKDLLTTISSESPQFNIVKFSTKTFFIYTCPSGSKVKERMIYASNKQGVINHFKQFFTIDKALEAGDAIELELSEFGSENENEDSSAATKPKFNRPTRPGRRR